MTWKRTKDGWERSCKHCAGTGKETLFRDGACYGCPYNDVEEVEHPANSKREDGGIGHTVVRCNRCGGVWLVYFDYQDDSWDVPKPEYLGTKIPDLKWRKGDKVE